MKNRIIIVILITLLLTLHILVHFNNILLVTPEDKNKIIQLFNLPSDANIFLVKGYKGLHQYSVSVYYKYSNETIKQDLVPDAADSEGSETRLFLIMLNEKTIKILLLILDIFLFIFCLIILYKKYIFVNNA